MGAKATDHGLPNAFTAELDEEEFERLFQKALRGKVSIEDADNFRGHMIMEFAKMSLNDG